MSAPTSEIGYANTTTSGWWAAAAQEDTPELRWPASVPVYDRMRRQDAQAASVLRAVTMPVRRTRWRIDPAGTRDEVAEHVAQDLRLPIMGQSEPPAGRSRDRFSWGEHLQLALLSLSFGHMFFEQRYRIVNGKARLHKLAPRMPSTLSAINVAADGGLVSIEQYGGNRPIPVTRLVAYVHDREAGNWYGSSLLRPAYKHWVIKDRLLRVQAQTVERNGMGVPLYKGGPKDKDLDAGRKLATDWRSGEDSGAAVPEGSDLLLRGVDGDLPDADAPIRYHDEQIARAVLAHFLNLGTQTGSWALGTTFADFFTLSLQTVAEGIADVANQHVVEDLVDLNFGLDEPAPRVVPDEIGSRHAVTAQAMKLLIDAGAVVVDRALEEHLRQTYGLPGRDESTQPTVGNAA